MPTAGYECVALNENVAKSGRLANGVDGAPCNGANGSNGCHAAVLLPDAASGVRSGRKRHKAFVGGTSVIGCTVLLACILVMLFGIFLLSSFVYRLTDASTGEYCMTNECIKVSGVMMSKMNRSVDPCDDFYEYACGQWKQDTPMPYMMLQWNEIYRIGMDAWTTVRRRFEQANDGSSYPLNRAQLKAQKLYQSCMDEEALQKLGMTPMLDFVGSVGGWLLVNNTDDRPAEVLETSLLNLFRSGYYPIIWVGVALDEMNTSRHVIMIDQPVLSYHQVEVFTVVTVDDLLARNASDTMLQLFDFIYYVAREVFGAADTPQLNTSIASVIEFEAGMATLMLPEAQKRDALRTYHLTSLKELTSTAPFVNWSSYIPTLFPKDNIIPDEPIVVKGIDWLKQLSHFVQHYQATEHGRRVIENYVKWRAIMHQFTFLGQGCTTFPPSIKSFVNTLLMVGNRWIFCLTRTMQIVTMPLASLFVRLQPNGRLVREEVLRITDNVIDILRDEVAANKWMDANTRQTAMAKVERIRPLIAFPDNVYDDADMEREFEPLDIQEDDFFWNMMRGMRFAKQNETGLLRKSPNRTTWTIDSSPMKVNAFYTFEKNIIVVPAAILSPPLFSIGAPTAVNYASIGTIIGHELTHAFDNRGRHYDEWGNLRQWWSEKASREYVRKAECLNNQYSNYTVQGIRVNGSKTSSENIADNVGLKLAYKAWRRQDDLQHQRFPGLNMTAEQAFFLGYAQTWCAKITQQYEMFQVYYLFHSTERLRVIGPLHNMPEFAEAFSCPKGSPMVPQTRCAPLWPSPMLLSVLMLLLSVCRAQIVADMLPSDVINQYGASKHNNQGSPVFRANLFFDSVKQPSQDFVDNLLFKLKRERGRRTFSGDY